MEQHDQRVTPSRLDAQYPMADSQEVGLKVIARPAPFPIATIYAGLTYDNLQVKTKAKKRYLKAKKERRKQRKLSTHDTIHSEGGAGDNPGDIPPEKSPTVIDLAQLTGRSKFAAEDGSEKSKKRKLDHPIQEGSAEDHQPPVEADKPNFGDGSGSNRALPLFPLPTHPDAPSKTELALQGLDRAQIEAELVDPNSTLSIDFADNNSSGLGLKIRRVLIDLGINELFAGISHSFVRLVLPAAKVEQFRRPLFRFCSVPATNTLAFTTHITRRGMCVSRPRLVAGRRSHIRCQSLR